MARVATDGAETGGHESFAEIEGAYANHPPLLRAN